MAMYTNMIHPIPHKKQKNKNPTIDNSNQKVIENKKEEKQEIENQNDENKEEIKPGKNLEQKDENQNNNE